MSFRYGSREDYEKELRRLLEMRFCPFCGCPPHAITHCGVCGCFPYPEEFVGRPEAQYEELAEEYVRFCLGKDAE